LEAPVELVEGLEGAELSGLGATSQKTLLADVEFVLEDQFEELAVAQAIGGGFLQPNGQALAQTGQAQLL